MRPSANKPIVAWTEEEIVSEMESSSTLEKARKEFSAHRSRISNAGEQSTPLLPTELRRMEFLAVRAIMRAWNGMK